MKSVLLAGAMTFAVIGTAHADSGGMCFRLRPDNSDYVCYSDDDADGEILTLSEEMQIARIIANAQKRAEVRAANQMAENEKERAIEDARRAKCAVPLLWINCPARTPESERYWNK